MDRSLFPEGVEIHQTDLEGESTARIFHTLKRFADSIRPGVISGLSVGANNNGTISVAAGSAYCTNGELIEVTGTGSLAVSSAVLGVVNYVCVQYTEAADTPRAHVTSGIPQDTKITRGSQIVVHTIAEYNALSTVDADSRAIIAHITGAGAGVAVTAVTQQTAYDTTLTATRTSAHALTGVQIVDVKGVAVGSTISLRYDGAGLEFNVDGGVYDDNTTITTQTQVTLDHGGWTLVVDVDKDQLVAADDTFLVSDIYTDVGALFSQKDVQHRDTRGSGLINSTNPHGLTFSDIAASSLSILIPRLLEIGNELLATDAHALLPRLLIGLRSGARTLIAHLNDLSGDEDIRLYVAAGARSLEVTINARYDGSNWYSDDNAEASAYFSVGLDLITLRQHAATSTGWLDSAWADRLRFNTSSGISSLVSTLALGSGMLGSATAALSPRLTLDARATDRTLLFESGVSGRPKFRAYLIGSLGSPILELTSNSSWSSTTSRWTRYDNTENSWKISLTKNKFEILSHASAGTAEWTNTVSQGANSSYGYWEKSPLNLDDLDTSSADLTVAGSVNAGGNATISGSLTSNFVTSATNVVAGHKMHIPGMPAATDTGLGGDVYRTSTVKAWGTVHVDSTVSPNTVASVGGQGIDEIAFSAGSILVTLADHYSHANGRSIINCWLQSIYYLSGGNFLVPVHARGMWNTTNQILLHVYGIYNNVPTALNLSTIGVDHDISFMIIGEIAV